MGNLDPLVSLQRWYLARCDGNWEHGCGINIGTLDNPGWTLTIDLTGTGLETKEFVPVKIQPMENTADWLHCWVDRQRMTFEAASGPLSLSNGIAVFLAWATDSRP